MKISLLLFSVFALSAGTALAQDHTMGPSPHKACKADVAALCPGIQPGGGRVSSCLKQNEAKVSPRCKDAIAQAHERKAQSKASPCAVIPALASSTSDAATQDRAALLPPLSFLKRRHRDTACAARQRMFPSLAAESGRANRFGRTHYNCGRPSTALAPHAAHSAIASSRHSARARVRGVVHRRRPGSVRSSVSTALLDSRKLSHPRIRASFRVGPRRMQRRPRRHSQDREGHLAGRCLRRLVDDGRRGVRLRPHGARIVPRRRTWILQRPSVFVWPSGARRVAASSRS